MAAENSSGRRVMRRDRLARVGQWLCLAGAILGALGLIGWIAGVVFLTTVLPERPPMVPNTALSLMLVGVAGALRLPERKRGVRRALALVAAAVVLALGLGTLAEYALGVDFYIDRLVVRGLPPPYPGRPSPPTALALSLLSAAILLFDVRLSVRARLAEWLAMSAGLIAFTALLGMLFGAGPLYVLRRDPVIGVALPTALALMLIAGGLLLERPGAGLLSIATSPGPGGVLVRRLWLVAFVAPALLGLVMARLLPWAGFHNFPLVFAILAVAMTVSSLFFLIVTAVPLNRTHEDLESSRALSRDLVQEASDGIFLADLNGRYTDVNAAGCRMLGYSREELVGKTILDLIPEEDAERLLLHKMQLLAGVTEVSEWRIRRKDGGYLPVEVSAKILADGRWQGLVRDISERKRAEEQLRQSQERLDLALRGADLASWDWNITTGEVIFNARWAEMRGFRSDEVRPYVEAWVAGVHPDDLPLVQKALTDCFEGLIPDYETEHRVRTKSGDFIWILDHGRVFARDEQGKPTRMVGTELEITARKRVEAALQLSEAKSSGIVAVSADAIISIDEAQRITLFNEGAEKIFGYSKSEALGARLDLLIPERFRAVHRQHVDRFSKSPEAARRMGDRGMQIFGLRKNGTEFPADAAISKLEVGGTRLLTVAIRDVTEQRRVESEQRFLAEAGSVLASALDYEDTLSQIAQIAVRDLADVCIVDIAGEAGDLRRLKVTCRDPEKAWAGDILMQNPPDGRRQEAVGAALRGERAVLIEVSQDMVASFANNEEQLRAIRAIDPQSLILAPLVARGNLLGAIALVASRSSRAYGAADVRLTQELARRAALSIDKARLYRLAQRAIQARDDVLGIVAHDLRNPLSTILMQAGLLRLHDGEPESRVRKPADTIERAARRMSRLIDDLLDVTRMEAGRLEVQQARVPVERLMSDAIEAQRGIAAQASIELRLDLARDLPDVWADRDRLLQIFENLIGNAIKFSQAEGSIVAGGKSLDGEVLFWVADNGVGIASDDLPHVFDRFWQAHKNGYEGAGLGLPIVKGLVESHGGRIWVESAPDVGSTFFFTIPTALRAEWRDEAAPHRA